MTTIPSLRMITPERAGDLTKVLPEIAWPVEIVDYWGDPRNTLADDFVSAFDKLLPQPERGSGEAVLEETFDELTVRLTSIKEHHNPTGSQAGGYDNARRVLALQKTADGFLHWLNFTHVFTDNHWLPERNYTGMKINVGAETETQHDPTIPFGSLIGVSFEPVVQEFKVNETRNVVSPTSQRLFGAGVAILRVM